MDTVADIALNGAVIARAENAHREHRLAVKSLLKEGPNTLVLTILPAVLEAFAKNATYPYPAPILTYQVIAPYNFLRKPASDFGWDWGPAFAPSGVYGDVSLVGYSAGMLTGANAHQTHAADGGSVALTFDAYVRTPVAGEAGTLTVKAANGAWGPVSREVTLGAAGLNTVPISLTVEGGFELWWPTGYGGQPLYDFELAYTPRSIAAAPPKSQAWGGAGGPEGAAAASALDLSVKADIPGVASFAKAARVTASADDGDESEAMVSMEVVEPAPAAPAGADLAEEVTGTAAAPAAAPAASSAPASPSTTTLTRRVGFRTIELVREPLARRGGGARPSSSAVNGVPVYAKGTNMIPLHIFASKTTAADLIAHGRRHRRRQHEHDPGLGRRPVPAGRVLRRVRRGGRAGLAGVHGRVRHVPARPGLPGRGAPRRSPTRPAASTTTPPWPSGAATTRWRPPSAGSTPSGANRAPLRRDYTALFVDIVRAALLRAVASHHLPGLVALEGRHRRRRARLTSSGGATSADWQRGDVHFYTDQRTTRST